jgi:iron complex transport system substrate-binding protein
MRKAARYWIVLATLCALLTGCAQSAGADTPPYYAFTDSADTHVTLTHKPEKVAVLFSSFAEVWALAGGQTAITVGESIERGFAPQDAQLVDEGAGKSINLEALIAAQPDFVILIADIAAQAQSARLGAGRDCRRAVSCKSFDDYLAMLRSSCEITGNETA